METSHRGALVTKETSEESARAGAGGLERKSIPGAEGEWVEGCKGRPRGRKREEGGEKGDDSAATENTGREITHLHRMLITQHS